MWGGVVRCLPDAITLKPCQLRPPPPKKTSKNKTKQNKTKQNKTKQQNPPPKKGYTGFTVGLVNTHYVYLPIPVIIQAPRKVNPKGRRWNRLKTAINMPDMF